MGSDNINITFQIKEEQLDIAKRWMQTCNVNVYRETSSTNKSITIPVKREELVIEKRNVTLNSNAENSVPVDIIRIPLSEERIEVTKHTVNLEDVSVYKQQVTDIKHIEENLKKEKFKVNVIDSP